VKTGVSNTRPAVLFGNFTYVAKCLEERMIPSAVFVPPVALQNKFPPSSRFLRNLGSMPNTISRNHTTGFLVKSFGECCESTVLTAACYWPSSHCIPAQRFVSMLGELITTVHSGCWTPTKVCAATTTLRSLLYE